MKSIVLLSTAAGLAAVGVAVAYQKRAQSAAQAEVQPPPAPADVVVGIMPVEESGGGGLSGLVDGLGGAAPIIGAGLALAGLTAELGQVITGHEEGAVAGLAGPVVGLAGAVGARIGEELADVVGIEGAGRTTATIGGAAAGVAGAVLGVGTAVALAPTIAVAVGVAELAEYFTQGDGYGAVGPGHQVGSRSQQTRNQRVN